jgi:hypothetical protein
MKRHFTPITLAIALAVSTAWLIGEPTKAVASESSGLTPSEANRLSRDLATPSPSQDFFRQGQQMMEGEIQRLLQRQNASSDSPLKTEPSFQNNVDIQKELDRLPQLQPNNPNQPSVAR